MKSLADTITLSNGVEIPCVGFGTWQTPSGKVASDSVVHAINAGYRHIDAAAIYRNEKSVGEGIAASGIQREELFVTSKLWNSERGYNRTIAAYEKTLSDLKLDYLDLYLVHWPAAIGTTSNWEEVNADTWRAMERLYHDGRVKSIGVSNFLPHHLSALTDMTEVTPTVNQIEFHPGFMQSETIDFCRQNDILVEAWSPLGTGKMLLSEALQKIADKYSKSVAQLCIRWCLQNDTVPLPKSATPARIIENAQVFDFVISDEDMAQINTMPYFGGSGLNPDEVRF